MLLNPLRTLIFKLCMTLLAFAAGAVLWQRGQLQVLALQQIDPLPAVQAMVAEKRYTEAADYLAFFMEYGYVRNNPDAQKLQQHIAQTRQNWQYQFGKVWEGAIKGQSDEAAGQMASVISDFLVVGDIRDLGIQAWRYAHDEQTDPVIAALSGLGLAATSAQIISGAGTVGTAGASAPALAASTTAKRAAGTLKGMRKMGQLPDWLSSELVRASKISAKTGNLDEAKDLLQSMHTLSQFPGGLRLLKHTQDMPSLRRMAAFAESFGPHSATLYRLGGNQALHAAEQLHRLDKSSIKLATTYGKNGLKALDEVGSIRFAKYAARAAKITAKGQWLNLLARWLLALPVWLLILIAALGPLAWLPHRRRLAA